VAGVSEQKGAIEIVEPTRAERAVIRRSAESRATVPDLELEVEVDITAMPPGTAGLEPEILAAAARVLTEHRRLNGAYRDGHYELHSRVNAGVVLGEEPAYPVATVFDADRLEPEAIAAELARLRGRAATGELSPPELSGATFSFWFAGGAGIARAVLPVIPPHAAALVAGAPRTVPVIRDGSIVPGQLVTLTLACDHRIAFGPHAAGFLTAVRARLEKRVE
jgi:pyruvate dehydrogenase E2 component (dihydrolipoamide acetyltransferase)